MSINRQHANAETLAAWNANAAYWDNRMGDTGNDFVNELIWPAVTRLLQALLRAGFAAGFVVDALEERAFPPDNQPGRNPLGWSGKFSEFPPVLVVRMRLP